jgi:hypothetical protein
VLEAVFVTYAKFDDGSILTKLASRGNLMFVGIRFDGYSSLPTINDDS